MCGCHNKARREEAGHMGSTPPPPTNLYKINVDGAVFATQKAAGAGFSYAMQVVE